MTTSRSGLSRRLGTCAVPADFENQTGEEIFDGMLKQGLAIQLQQTPFLTLLPEARMRNELTLMKRQPNERVTAELARVSLPSRLR